MWFGNIVASVALALALCPSPGTAHEDAERPNRGAGSLETCAVTVPDLPTHPKCAGDDLTLNQRDHREAAAMAELRQQYGLNLKSSEGLWEVRESPGKGLGVFASREIAKGTRIMVEAPLFAIDPGRLVSGRGYSLRGLADAVEAAFAQLDETSQADYLSCHEHREAGETASRELLVFRSNAYSMPDGRVGIFPRIAKINHSCLPNAGNTFSEGSGARVIWAGRDIATGEEITVTYAPLTEPTERRRARLAQYGFRCECEACRASDVHGNADGNEQGDQARDEMRRLFELVEAELGSTRFGRDVLPEARRLARLVEEYGLVDYRARAYRLAAYAASRIGDYGAARDMAARELKTLEMADSGSPNAKAAHDFMAALPRSEK